MNESNVKPWEHQKQIIAPHRTFNEIIQEAPITKFVADKEFITPVVSTTPDVSNVTHLIASGGTITNFLNGQPGQSIYILGDGATTIIHNPGMIFCSGGVNITLSANLFYHFKLFGSQWSQSA